MHTLLMVACCSISVLSGVDTFRSAHAYLDGVEAQRHARYDEAVLAYETCAARDDALAAYACVKAAACLVASGNRSAGIASYQHIIKGPKGPWVRMAQAGLAAALVLENNRDDAGLYFQTALTFEPKPWWVQTYDFKAASNAIQTTQYQDAGFAFFHDVVTRIRYRFPRLEAARELAKSTDPNELMVAALGLLRSAESDEALKVIRVAVPTDAETWSVLAADLTPKPEVKAPVKVSRTLKAGKTVKAATKSTKKTPGKKSSMTDNKVSEAIARVKSLVTAQSENPWTRIGLVYLVRITTGAGQTESAKILCDLFLESYPDGEEAPDVLYWLAARYEKEEKMESAISAYQRIATLFPKHYRADDALMSVAELSRKTGNKAASVAALRTLTEIQPDSILAPNAWYGQGLAAEHAGKKAEAIRCYTEASVRGVPITGAKLGASPESTPGSVGDYYAHRAWARRAALGDSEAAQHASVAMGGPAGFLKTAFTEEMKVDTLPAEVAADDRVRRLRFFGVHGLQEGEWEAVDLVETLQRDPQARAYYQALGESGFAATAMDYAAAFNWDCADGKPGIERLRVAYPRAYWTEIVAAAKEVDMDPYLLLATARQESTFRPALTSSAGARGVMQIMPGTAQLIAKNEPDIGQDGIDHLDIPHKSIRLGARYLKRMLERCGGNVAYALASYNAGPGNCAKWRATYGSASLEDFIENIPFSETRGYVKAVLGNYAAYHSLYPSEP